ncbi:metallophosphoesterase [Yasminevirus sp. GU-2018]|uniref:Metallophosphoesterase n=1 Tax=Yasminevirus sp. GU-2018 TaxID=2420051 RepID=A0A5K0UC33_9VIRU|nr:metallophosphoesterase [Yasminevirus sp. GU-2018]
MDDIKAKRLYNCARNKINFISGTVTPAQSNKTKTTPFEVGDIECIDIGLEFLFNMYEKNLTVSVQPKYMGSRFNVYLMRDDHLKRSYAVTRNGFLCTKLSRETLAPIYDKLHKNLIGFMRENNVKMMIIDGEILPWSALGDDLIENEFLPVDKGLETEIAYSEQYGFDEQLQKFRDSNSDIVNALKTSSRKDVTKTFGEAKVKEFDKIKEVLTVPSIETSKKLYKTFNEQMKLYGEYSSEKKVEKKTNLDYKPFGILKICFDDGSESIPLFDESYSQSEMYDIVRGRQIGGDGSAVIDDSEDAQLVVELTPETFESGVKKIRDYFNNLTYVQGYEGVVIKPDYVKKGALPMMKCRNTSYLSIIYGFDYSLEPKLTRLIKSKTTSSKIKQSIKEFNHGIEMLKIPYDEIGTDNEDYQKIMRAFLFEEEYGQKLDPRL